MAFVGWAGWGFNVVHAIRNGEPIPNPPVVVLREEAPRESAVDYTQTFGWQYDAEAVKANLDQAKTLHFETTPAGKAALGDTDVFLWQAVRRVNNKAPPWYPNVNQQSVGCCVGCGWKHSTDVCQATQIISGRRAEWKPASVEVIYGNSRVDIGKGRISGDGSVGAWAKAAVEKDGVAPMENIGGVDLSTFSPQRARAWGRSGVPSSVNEAAKDHIVKGCALVKTWTDVKRAITQGYPVAVCSNQGFTMERDSTGRCRPQGSWGHCMAIIAVRSGANEGGFILNSWGDQAHTGPTWPEDAPVAGFWADASVIDRMVGQNDSFALADIAGFPARTPAWFIKRESKRRDPLRIDRPELALAW